MEITLELVERLKEKADVTYAQAKEALEYSGGNLLDALIYLEEKGSVPREEGAYFSTKGETPPPPPQAESEPSLPAEEHREPGGRSAKAAPRKSSPSLLTTLRRWLIENELEIWRKETPITALPVLILILLVLFAFYLVVPALLIGLFAGFRYRFSGPDLDRDDLNGMMGTVADSAADIGHRVMDELKRDWHSDEQKTDNGRKP